MKTSESLLQLAQTLAKGGPRNSVMQRRAVSTAYYAVFHAMAQLCTDALLSRSQCRTADYERIYRALDHGSLRTAFVSAPLKNHAKLRAIGNLILELQNERHRSDYLPPQRLYSVLQCEDLVKYAGQILIDLDTLSAEDRRTLAICLLFKNR